MKKLIAVVLTVAMMLTVCAFTVSADAAPELIVEGPAYTQVGDNYTVNVRLNDAANKVGGFQGELVYTGAKVVDFQVNPEVLTFNNTEDKNTVMKDDGDSVNFATVTDLKGTNPATRIWFKVTFEITGEASFSFANVVYSDKNANELTGSATATLAPKFQTANDADITINKAGVLAQVEPNKQGIVVEAAIDIVTDNVAEYGVIFYPTSLLDGEELTCDVDGVVVASVKKGDAKFERFAAADTFSAVLHFNFSTDEKAAQFMGTKVSARVFYKLSDGTVVYSVNNVPNDKYIKSGVSSKAALNTILDFANTVTDNASTTVSVDEFNAAKAALGTSKDGWYDNRITVLTFAVENAKAQ